MARPPDKTARADLLAAALIEFDEHGVERATVEAITSRAGRSKGAFYLHFESKEAAFLALCESAFAGLGEFIGAVTPSSSLDWGLEALRAHWLETDLRAFEYVWQHRPILRLVLSVGMCGRFAYLVDAFATVARESIARWLEYGVERGFYRAELDIAITSMAIGGAYDRLARELVRLEKKPDLARWLSQFQATFVEGLAARERATKRGQSPTKPRGPAGEEPVAAKTRRASRHAALRG